MDRSLPSGQLALPLRPANSSGVGDRPSEAGQAPWDCALVHALGERISRRLGSPVRLEVHDNRTTMVSYRSEPDRVRLRIHHMFLAADEPVAQALADFARSRRTRRQAGGLLDAFIRNHRHHIRPPPPGAHLEPRGAVHDLEAIYQRLNDRCFAGTIDARIGWGRAPPRRRRHSVKLGIYYHDTRTIRIHRTLDRLEVPPFVVEFVVFHEMLHQACPTEPSPSGRTRIHTRLFRERERAHPDHARVLAWEKQHLPMLLARPR